MTKASREYYDRAVVAQRKLLKTPDVRDNTSKLRDAKLELANILNSLAAHYSPEQQQPQEGAGDI